MQRGDDREVILGWYRQNLMEEAVGHSLELRQANTSISKQGVVRGIHFAGIPAGQVKYLAATRGAVLDFVI